MSLSDLIVTSLLLLAATTVSAVISALETALFCLKEHHVVSLSKRDPELKKIIRSIARNPRRSVRQALFLSTIINLVLAVFGLFLLREAGILDPGRFYLTAVLLFGFMVVFGDLLPTLVALFDPGRVFRASVKPFVFLSPALERFSSFLDRVTELLSQRLVPVRIKPTRAFTDEEIETLVEMRRDDGVLLPGESEIIQEIIRLGNKTVKDCMTPRVDALLISGSLTNDEMLEEIRRHELWHWMIPVFGDSPDVITGILDLRISLRQPERPYQDFVSAPVFVPETMMALDVFRDYLSRPRSLAIVVDEYGGVDGVISHDDIIEEILEDAAPAPDQEQEQEIVVLGDGKLRAAGDARLDDIDEILGVDLEFEGLDTIGGLVFNEVGEVPSPGFEVVFPGVLVTVRETEGQRITKVDIIRTGEGNEASEPGHLSGEESDSNRNDPESPAGDDTSTST